jgi:hypothetical protein
MRQIEIETIEIESYIRSDLMPRNDPITQSTFIMDLAGLKKGFSYGVFYHYAGCFITRFPAIPRACAGASQGQQRS